ncbi:MAG: VOC family protein [Pseudomonadales bacterium]
MSVPLTPFHLAVQVRDIAEARDFYGAKLGFREGRSDVHWVDFDMFGHQLVVHLNPEHSEGISQAKPVDGKNVPVPHFGVVLTLPQWHEFKARLEEVISEFVVEPHIRFEGQAGEQATLFFLDPSGNALEFKAFADIESELFAR